MAVRANNLTDGYVPPDRLARLGADGRLGAEQYRSMSPSPPGSGAPISPMEQRMKGIRLTMAEYCRPDPRTAPSKSKATGLYMICTIEKHRAERMGYADALMLDWRGQVAESTGANIFFVRGDELHTPTPDCFLDGITRRTVIGLAKGRGLKVIERPIMPEEMGKFRAVFSDRQRRRSDAGFGDRRLPFHAGRHHQDADGRLFGLCPAGGEEAGGGRIRSASAVRDISGRAHRGRGQRHLDDFGRYHEAHRQAGQAEPGRDDQVPAVLDDMPIGEALAVSRGNDRTSEKGSQTCPPWVWPDIVSVTRSGTRTKISGSCASRISGSLPLICVSVPGRSSTPR